MATTKIWDVRGRLNQVVDYATNPQKTENPEYSKTDLQGLRDVMNYALNDFKTEQQYYVTGLNCNPKTARQDMSITKKQYQKEGGIIAYHGYQSFAYGEVTADLAHEIGIMLAKKLWGERFEVLVATHLDKKHIHNHFVLNSVSFADGKRYYDNKATYAAMRETSDTLCREYSLSVIEHPKKRSQLSYDAYLAREQDKPTWHGIIGLDIEEAIKASKTMTQFYKNLVDKGYELKSGSKYFTLRPPGKERFVRIERKFPEFSIEQIQKRILSKPGRETKLQEKNEPQSLIVKVSQAPKKRIGGFRGLYLHYCYLLGVFHGGNNRQMPFVVKEDLRKLKIITEETCFLWKRKIDTKEAVLSVRATANDTLEQLKKERKKLQNQLRSCRSEQERDVMRQQIVKLGEQIETCRKEIKWCNGILERSEVIKEKMAVIRKDKQPGKEKQKHEYVR